MQSLVRRVTAEGKLTIVAAKLPSPLDDDLKPDEIVIKVGAAPVHPSNILSFLAGKSGDGESVEGAEPTVSFPMHPAMFQHFKHQVGKTVRTGTEGAGIVVKTGSSDYAKSLKDKVVAFLGPGIGAYSEYVKVSSKSPLVIVHQGNVSPEDAASSFVNPVTVKCMVENAKQEGHKAIIQTAAASQVGQMLVRLCNFEKIPLVSIVRKESQEKLLRELGATIIVRSDKESYEEDLLNAVVETKATIAFDAIGGGEIVDQLLKGMENGAKKYGAAYNPDSFYGTSVHKQIYCYGLLDRAPITLSKTYGTAWGMGFWLMTNFLFKQSPEKIQEIKDFVANNIQTIFKTNYYKKISLTEAVDPKVVAEFEKMATGQKFLITP